MMVCVNNQEKDVQSENLSQLMQELGYQNMRLALALNGQFVPSKKWEITRVAPQSKIEIVAPMQGG